MKFKKICYLAIACLILWIIMIYSFSAQPVTESVGLSRKVGQKVAECLMPGFGERTVNEQEVFVRKIDFGIRKAAHFLEYMVLGMLWSLLLLPTKWKIKLKILICLGGSVLCAATDELHQLFVDGRTSRWQDVCIDTAGAATGIMILFGISWLVHRRKVKTCQKS